MIGSQSPRMTSRAPSMHIDLASRSCKTKRGAPPGQPGTWSRSWAGWRCRRWAGPLPGAPAWCGARRAAAAAPRCCCGSARAPCCAWCSTTWRLCAAPGQAGPPPRRPPPPAQQPACMGPVSGLLSTQEPQLLPQLTHGAAAAFQGQ